jgi:hypothetical protein
MDGVQIRREMQFRPATLLHINATPYNAGEKLRRNPALRWRLGLINLDYMRRLCDKHYPKQNIIWGVNEKTVLKRRAKVAAKKTYLQKLLYKKIAQTVETWRDGFEFVDPLTGTIYWVKMVCAHSIFDLPQLSEATGLVSLEHMPAACTLSMVMGWSSLVIRSALVGHSLVTCLLATHLSLIAW